MILFFTKALLEGRLSVKRVQRIFDDDNDGVVDSDPLMQLRRDASSKVASYLEPIGLMPRLEALVNPTTGELLAPASGFPEEVVRLALDVAVALACQRFPEIMRQDWQTLMAQAEKDLDRLRTNKTSLGGQGAQEAANEGGAIRSGDPLNPIPVPKVFANGTSDF